MQAKIVQLARPENCYHMVKCVTNFCNRICGIYSAKVAWYSQVPLDCNISKNYWEIMSRQLLLIIIIEPVSIPCTSEVYVRDAPLILDSCNCQDNFAHDID